MASTNTANLNLEKPADGEQGGEWGDTINSNMELLDAAVATKTGAETLTNKTLTSPVLNTGASGTAIKDEDNMASDSASHLATQQSIKAYVDSQSASEEEVEDIVGAMVTSNTETGIAVTYEDGDGTIDFVVSDTTVSGDSGSTGITPGDTLTIAGGTNVSTAMSGDTLTITSTDTNTQLSQEQVEDFVGGMVDSNTETGIAVTYVDGDGTLDFVVADTTVAGDSGSTGITPGDTLTIAGGANITTAMSGDTLTITGSASGSLADLDIDGGTDIGEALVDADLFIVDNGANGTNRKSALSRLKTYIGAASNTLTLYKFTATAGQSTFTGSDDASATLAYTAGALFVTLNGSVLENGTDYAATNGTSIVLTDAAALSHELNVYAFGTFDVANVTGASGDFSVADDLSFTSDAAVVNFGVNSDVALTHVHNTGLLLSSGHTTALQLQFGDSGTYIYQSADGVLDLVSDTEIELTATTIDINGAVAMDGAITGGTNITISGELDAATLVTSGIVSVDDTTTSTSGTTGSIHTDGGLGVAGTAFVAGTLASGTHTVGTNSSGNPATLQQSHIFNFKLNGDTPSQYGIVQWTNNGGTITGNMWGTGDSSAGTLMRIKSLGLIALVPGGVGIDGTVGYNFTTTGFTPPSDNGDTNGTAALRWSVVYAGTGSINTSDEREKQQIADLDAAELRVALAIKGMVKKFKFNDAVTAKGDNARIHVGVIAQDVRGAFIAEGLDPTKYGLFCYDAWPEIAEEIDDEGTVITQAREAGDRFGIRYDELLAFIIAAI